ncbi:MAG: acyl-CoA thioesterase [Actinomycetota bacterium]|nr:acyl-CoA thioesterase [Actinomycetota bacterium]
MSPVSDTDTTTTVTLTAAARGLLDVLDLEPSADPDSYVGQNQPQPWGRVFGGQVLAQSLVAAQRTVEAERPVHSMHGYFLRAGDLNEPITFTVDRLRDGRSFSARRVQASQLGRPILSMIASFQQPASGIDHSAPMPDVPPPDDLLPLPEHFPGDETAQLRAWLRHRPVEIRPVEQPLHVSPAERAGSQSLWIRVNEQLPDDPALHAAVLAYGSDFTILEPALRLHGLTWSTPGMNVASLDHALWWHRPVRADSWLLYVQESPSATGARALCTGRFHTADGELVASVAQEGMIRLLERPGA